MTAPPNLRVVREQQLGLSHARRRGFTEAAAPLVVLVDDDNLLTPQFLASACAIFENEPELGIVGGPSRPEFATPPPDWLAEFRPLLALRDLGDTAIVSTIERDPTTQIPLYPRHAPIGAGMVLRHEVAAAWSQQTSAEKISDRKGSALTSGGDNDIVLHALRDGWKIGYFPSLALTHLIPAGRTKPAYLARLNRGIASSWVEVLHRHGACPWPPISRGSLPLRKFKAWFHNHGWSHPVGYIRWQGACGHFEGRAQISG